MQKRLLTLCLLATLSASCANLGTATQSAIQISDTGCKWARPIYVGSGDKLTDETARQILAHNKAWAAACGSLTPQRTPTPGYGGK